VIAIYRNDLFQITETETETDNLLTKQLGTKLNEKIIMKNRIYHRLEKDVERKKKISNSINLIT